MNEPASIHERARPTVGAPRRSRGPARRGRGGSSRAGSLLLERFLSGTAGRISSKTSPTDLVSEADLASERAIGEVLARRAPGRRRAGRGGRRAGRPQRAALDRRPARWDRELPLRHAPLVRERRRRGLRAERSSGAIFDPNREELFTARRAGPALLNGIPLSPRRGEDLSHAMVATGLAYEARVRAAQAQVLARLIPRVRDIRRFGSAALDLAWTAAGLYDAYFERSVRRWDVAAGALICERAGLRVLELPDPRGPAVGDPRRPARARGRAARAGRRPAYA